MSYHQELFYENADIEPVVGIQFGVLSPDEIINRSVAEINTQETYDGENPKIGGLFDPRMGVLDHGKICPTDGLDNRFCPGYFGHIQLAIPCIHIQFQNCITKILKCVCYRCSKCLIDINSDKIIKLLSKKTGPQRLKIIELQCKNVKRCGECNIDGCGALQPDNIKKDSGTIGKICAEWKIPKNQTDMRDKKIIWTPTDILKIFKRIIVEDYEAMGFSRYWCQPEWLICTVLPVPPPSVRPSVRNDSNTRMEDDLTHKLCDIVKTNRILKMKIEAGAPQNVIEEWGQLLQYHIATLIDNQQPGIPPAQQRSGRPLKSIRERLRSKEGRVRGNLMGKRVDFSARSVITPDPNIELDELGVPIKIAMNLTIPEKVTTFNIKFLSLLVNKENPYDNWPGVKTIRRISDNQVISLKHIDTRRLRLEIGDVVNRHLLDGDTVLFNRQPSLHRMSMMAHRVKVMEYSTFRLNVSVTTPYNADFDGDEMNMHVPQSIQSSVEINKLASVTTQIISPSQNKPIISFVQDTLLGSYLFTLYKQFFSESEVCDILVATKVYDGVLPKPDLEKGLLSDNLPDYFPKNVYYKYLGGEPEVLQQNLWSGRSLLSICLPPINISLPNGNYEDSILSEKNQNFVEINEGIIKSGVFDKNLLGGKDGGLIHSTYNDYGTLQTKNLLDSIQNVITKFMLNSSFSIGIGDLVANKNTMLDMEKEISNKKRKVIDIIEKLHNSVLENNSGKPMSEEFEIQVNSALNEAVGEAGKIGINQLSNDNRMVTIVKSGSKGSKLNIGQMISLVGQQNIDGKRIPYGFTDRTLPHFHKYDDGPSARGFVENSFLKGLNPHEFFFHAMGGREGVIDTAVKTSETGYIQRKLIKAMEDLKVETDLTIRNANGIIVQFLYGEDGFDPIKIERQSLPLVKMSIKDMKEKYFPDMFISIIDNLYNKTIVDKINSNLEQYMESLDAHFNRLVVLRNFIIENIFKFKDEHSVYLPINIKRLIENANIEFPNKSDTNDLDPIYVLEKIKYILKVCKVTNTNSNNLIFESLISSSLSPLYLVQHLKLSKLAFDYIYTEIIRKFQLSIDEPGNLVGIIAAQSIGEPATQMTLNTFHFAGVGSKSEVVRGVPRLKEIISVSKNMKSPMLSVFLNDDISNNKHLAMNVLNSLEITTINDITESSQIYYEKNGTVITEDLEMMNDWNLFNSLDSEEETIDSEYLPWLLRLVFDRESMINKEIKMIDIFYAINSKFNKESNGEGLKITFSDDNAEVLRMRILIKVNKTDDYDNCSEDDMITLLKTLENSILNDIIIKGVKGIAKASMNFESGYLIKNGEDYTSHNQWVLDTVGTNLIDVLNHPHIDSTKTYSNSINEIYEILGIEAAREAIINEITELLSFDGTYINYRHISLLADIMTNRGTLMSIDRHGINKSDRGPLAKCSFEETPDIISKAAIFGEYDKMTGVSSNIMLGQEVVAGTGFSDVLFDEEFYIKHKLSTQVEPEQENIDSLMDDMDNTDEFCNDDNFTFNFNDFDDNIKKEQIDMELPVIKLD